MTQEVVEISAELYHLVHRLGKVFRTVDAASGVPTAQLSALITVVMHGPLPMSALARYELVTPQSVSRVVDDLDNRGLTRRTLDEADRRRTLVESTAKGRRLALAARKRKIDHLGDFLAELDDADRVLVRRSIAVLEPILRS